MLAVALLAWMTALSFSPVRVGIAQGESMAPAFHSGSVFLFRRPLAPPALQPGMAVVVRVDGTNYLKRVYACAGDTVLGVDWPEIEGSPDLFVSPAAEARVNELITRHRGLGRIVHLTVPAGAIYVVGDAVGRSYDSRHFGPVPISSVLGGVVYPSSPAPSGLSAPRAEVPSAGAAYGRSRGHSHRS